VPLSYSIQVISFTTLIPKEIGVANLILQTRLESNLQCKVKTTYDLLSLDFIIGRAIEDLNVIFAM
jgi:hypothetical protein